MSTFGEIKLADGRTVNLIQQAWNDNNAQGKAAWFADGYLSDENPDDETGPTVRVEWASKGAEEAEDDADWDCPVSIKHYAHGELTAA